MKKSFLFMMVVTFVTPSFFLDVSCPQAAAEKAIDLKIAYDTPPTSTRGRAVELFKELVENGSSGEIKVRIYHSGALGKAIQILEGLKAGAIEVFIGGSSPLTSFDERLALFDLPFLIRDWDHGERILFSPLMADLNEPFLKKTGLRIFGWSTSGFQGFYNSKRPILTLEDIKGLKMRTMESPVKIMAMNAYGAKAVAMAFPEFYPAMQHGVVDGGENSVETYQTAKHHEVAKYYTETDHVMLPTSLVVDEKFFQRLSPKNRQVLLEAGAKSQKELYKMVKEEVQKCADIAKKGGAKFYKLNTGEREKFEKAIFPVFDKFSEKVSEAKEFIARIKAAK